MYVRSQLRQAQLTSGAAYVRRNLRQAYICFFQIRRRFIEILLCAKMKFLKLFLNVFTCLTHLGGARPSNRPSKEPRPDLKAERKDQEQLEKNGINYRLKVREIAYACSVIRFIFSFFFKLVLHVCCRKFVCV